MHTDTTLFYRNSDENQSKTYYWHFFSISPNCEKIEIDISFNSEIEAQIPIILFDEKNKIRYFKASEGFVGSSKFNFHIAIDDSSLGGEKGAINQGIWKVVFFKKRLFNDCQMSFDINLSYNSEIKKHKRNQLKEVSFDKVVKSDLEKWYCGELHVHSTHSTGRSSLTQIFEKSIKEELDFIAITDHFTFSHWIEIQSIWKDSFPLCLKSIEISGSRGHLNIHGLNNWINPLINDNEELCSTLNIPRPSMNQIIHDAKEQGALVSINHPFSAHVGWRYSEVDFSDIDLLEVWCLSDQETSFLYPHLWDNYLSRGYRIIGIASSDSHKCDDHEYWELGKIRTWIKSKDLSQQGILTALKKGNVFISLGKSKLEFSVMANNREYCMGDTVALYDLLKFSVTLYDIPRGSLYIIIDSQIHKIISFEESNEIKIVSFEIKKTNLFLKNSNSYVRIEYHETLEEPKYFGNVSRSYKSMRLLSNPIWIDKKDI